TGYLQTHRMYQAINCQGCPMRGPCHKAEGNRIIQRSPNLVRYKQTVRDLLTSDEGIEKRKQRWQVEAVFGNIKQNKGFRRFNLRGIDKATTEIGLIAIAHNLQGSASQPQSKNNHSFSPFSIKQKKTARKSRFQTASSCF
ncbi:MAG: transposase, partial [Pyrinomonadaceae bacterium]